MTTCEEAQWDVEQTPPPAHASFRQTAVWDEAQFLGDVARRPTDSYQGIAYARYEQMQQRGHWSRELRNVQQHYLIVDSDREVTELLHAYPRLYLLLLEAVRPLQSAFGDRLFQIRVQHSDYDSLLKVAVQLPADFAQPEVALKAFDNDWWINNCQRSSGALVFDYEIQDGV